MQGRWIAISAARARAHRLYGVRGWLVTLLWLSTLPALVVVLAMAMVLMLGEMGGGAARPVLATSVANIRAKNAHRANRRQDVVEDGIRIVRFMSCSLKTR